MYKIIFAQVLTPKIVVRTAPKNDLMIVLSYLGKLLLKFALRVIVEWKINSITGSLRIVFNIKFKLINFFTFKDKIPVFLRSGIAYKFRCGGCDATYHGKTKGCFKIRMCKYIRVYALTGKRVNNRYII